MFKLILTMLIAMLFSCGDTTTGGGNVSDNDLTGKEWQYTAEDYLTPRGGI